MRRVRVIAAALAAAASVLAGCGDLDIGEGTAPTRLTIHYNGIEGGYQTYECAAFQLTATAHFEGERETDGDVTTRVTWRSSNPGVIDVSNGDIEAEPGSGTYFPAGTVIARTAGTAVIRADYVGLSDSFGVTADPIGHLRITPELTRMAPGSKQTFALRVTLEDDTPEQDLTASAVWRIPTAGAPVELSSGSTVQALTDPLDQPFVLEAQLFTCDRKVERELALDAVRVLRLSYEQPQDVPLPLGYSDEIRVEAIFEDDDAPPQNLSAQVGIEQILGDADEASIVADEYLTIRGAKSGASAQFRLRYEPLALEVPTRIFDFTDAEILGLRVTPERSELFYPDTLQLQAFGWFEDGYERPVRRDVTWTSLDADLVSVATAGSEIGKVTPQGAEGLATVRATARNTEGELKADADIRVYRP